MIPPKQRKRVKKLSDAKASTRVERKKSTETVARAISTTIGVAVSGLRNNELKSRGEDVGYPKELVTAFRGMFGANKEYSFEIRFVSALSTTSGGALLTALALSPSVSSYAEWSALAALFDEVKAIRTTLTLIGTNGAADNSGAYEMPVQIACDHVNLSSNPASTLAVVRLAGSRSMYSTKDTAPKVLKARLPGRLWCISGTPYSQSPLGGCIGTWSIGNFSIGAGSTQYFSTVTRLYIKLRCRA